VTIIGRHKAQDDQCRRRWRGPCSLVISRMDEMSGREEPMSESRLSRATDAFKAAGHPARLRILNMLRPGGLCVCQITAVLDLAVSTVSAHLAELRRAGLVTERKDGRWVSYRLAEDAEATRFLAQAWALLGADPQLASDARLVRSLRRVPVEELCRVDLDVTRFGLKRQAVR
jgi:DNA-binding transcriptional ArsR family regulator